MDQLTLRFIYITESIHKERPGDIGGGQLYRSVEILPDLGCSDKNNEVDWPKIKKVVGHTSQSFGRTKIFG